MLNVSGNSICPMKNYMGKLSVKDECSLVAITGKISRSYVSAYTMGTKLWEKIKRYICKNLYQLTYRWHQNQKRRTG